MPEHSAADDSAALASRMWAAVAQFANAQVARKKLLPKLSGGLEGAYCTAWQNVNDTMRELMEWHPRPPEKGA